MTKAASHRKSVTLSARISKNNIELEERAGASRSRPVIIDMAKTTTIAAPKADKPVIM